MSDPLTQVTLPFTYKKLAQYVLYHHLNRLNTTGVAGLLPAEYIQNNLSEEALYEANQELFGMLDKQLTRLGRATRKLPNII